MEDKEIQKIKEELDLIINQFNNENFINQDFINYSKTIKYSIFKNQNLHKTKRECEVIGCNEESIKRSHSIPKTSILKNIASEGHLLKPGFDLNTSFPINKMDEIGINNASVFPGYCEKHENLFQSFEKDGKIDSAKKAILQTYRTLCRERVYREIELYINEKAKNEYKDKINNDALKSIKEAFSEYPEFKFQKIDIEGADSVISRLGEINSYISKPLHYLEKFEKNIFSLLLNLPNNNLNIRVSNINLHLPVSICGIGNQVYIDKGVTKEAYVLLNVMPRKNSSDIVCVYLDQDKVILDDFFDYSFSNPLYIINMIESFMVNGTDHWYINPDFWNKIPKKKQDKILYDILYSENSFIDEYPISIFDNIRKQLITILLENIKKRKSTITDIEKERIAIEQNKLKLTNYEMVNDESILREKLLDKLKKH